MWPKRPTRMAKEAYLCLPLWCVCAESIDLSNIRAVARQDAPPSYQAGASEGAGTGDEDGMKGSGSSRGNMAELETERAGRTMANTPGLASCLNPRL